MRVINKPRNSGKTTILLHYMVCNPNSLYVAITENCAECAFKLSRQLQLHLNIKRFIGMCTLALYEKTDYTVLVDDIDLIISRHPLLAFDLIKKADMVTINKGE